MCPWLPLSPTLDAHHTLPTSPGVLAIHNATQQLLGIEQAGQVHRRQLVGAGLSLRGVA